MLFDILFYAGIIVGHGGLASLVFASMTKDGSYVARKRFNVAGTACLALAALLLDAVAVMRLMELAVTGLSLVPVIFAGMLLSLFTTGFAALAWLMWKRPAHLHPPHFQDMR